MPAAPTDRGQDPTPPRPRLPRRAVLQAGGAGLAAAGLALAGRPVRIRSQEASPGAPAADAPFPPETQLALEAVVDGALAQTATPGALVGVWFPGRGSWVKAAGVGDLATAAPAAPGDHVRIASITKTFVATVVLQLADEGRLGLDDPLERYVPGVPNGGAITLRQVLGMTAGIADFVADPLIAGVYARDPLLPFTPEQAVAIVRRGTPDFAPGERTQYSNSNYVLLGLVVEQVTGQGVETEIEERVIRPLGLTGTSFPTTPDMPEPFMHGYTAEALGAPLVDVTRSNPGVPWTSGAIVSTLADLRTWAEALANGALLSPASQRARLAWTPIPTPLFDLRYGLGIMEINGLVGHNGGIVGYSSWMLHAPAEGATLVVVTNRSATEGGTADPIFYGIVRLLFPDRFPPLPAPATPAGATPGP